MKNYQNVAPWKVFYWEKDGHNFSFCVATVGDKIFPFGLQDFMNKEGMIKAAKNSLSVVKQYGSGALDRNGDIKEKFLGLLQRTDIKNYKPAIKFIFTEFPVEEISFEESLSLGIGYDIKPDKK